jgi:hypothetical protein
LGGGGDVAEDFDEGAKVAGGVGGGDPELIAEALGLGGGEGEESAECGPGLGPLDPDVAECAEDRERLFERHIGVGGDGAGVLEGLAEGFDRVE